MVIVIHFCCLLRKVVGSASRITQWAAGKQGAVFVYVRFVYIAVCVFYCIIYTNKLYTNKE